MFETLDKRVQYVNQLKTDLEQHFTKIDYQVWIFGSFLTEEFNAYSDIDVSVYCNDIGRMIEIKDFLKDYFEKDSLDSDIVMFEFSKSHYINIPIVVYGKALTDYEPPNWLEYIKEMIDIWGINTTGRER